MLCGVMREGCLAVLDDHFSHVLQVLRGRRSIRLQRGKALEILQRDVQGLLLARGIDRHDT